jgi:hypothetical protein
MVWPSLARLPESGKPGALDRGFFPCPDRRQATHTRRWRFSGPVTDVLCKPSFVGFVAKCRVRWKQPLPDELPAIWKNGSRTAALQSGDGALSTHSGCTLCATPDIQLSQ